MCLSGVLMIVLIYVVTQCLYVYAYMCVVRALKVLRF